MVAFYQQERTKFRANDAVAIVRRLPWGTEVIRVTKVRRVGATLIETVDNQFFVPPMAKVWPADKLVISNWPILRMWPHCNGIE
jgi:hypothetical protein